jgi:hypothetical protein
MSVRASVIKKLALEYQQTKNPRLIERIILRIDDLLLRQIIILNKSYARLKIVPLQDLYQTAIVGVCKGITHVKASESDIRTRTRLMHYAKHEILKTYKRRRDDDAIRFSTLPDKFVDEMKYYTNNGVETNMLVDDIKMQLEKSGVVTKEDIAFIESKINNDLTYPEMAVLHGISRGWACGKVNRILRSIRGVINSA